MFYSYIVPFEETVHSHREHVWIVGLNVSALCKALKVKVPDWNLANWLRRSYEAIGIFQWSGSFPVASALGSEELWCLMEFEQLQRDGNLKFFGELTTIYFYFQEFFFHGLLMIIYSFWNKTLIEILLVIIKDQNAKKKIL